MPQNRTPQNVSVPKKTVKVVIRQTPDGPVTWGISLGRKKVQESILTREGKPAVSVRTVKEVLTPKEYREVSEAQFKEMRKAMLVEEYDPEFHTGYRNGDARGPLFDSVATPPRIAAPKDEELLE